MREIIMISLTLSVSFTLMLIHFIRKKYLREQYALLWLLFGVGMIGLSLSTVWLDIIAQLLNIYYAPSLLFLMGIIFCLTLILYLTVVISRLSDRIIRLTQEIGILKHRLEKNVKLK